MKRSIDISSFIMVILRFRTQTMIMTVQMLLVMMLVLLMIMMIIMMKGTILATKFIQM